MTPNDAPAVRAGGDDLAATPGPAPTTAAQDLADFHRRLAGPGAALAGPGGHALVPVELLDSVRHLHTPGSAAREAGATTRGVGALDDIGVVRTAGTPAAGAEPDPAAVAALARLRHAWSRQLLEDVIGHLATRTTGGKPVLDQQLVKGALADAFAGQQETETVLSATDADRIELDLLHERISDVDRLLLRLVGAHGFTEDGPGRTAHLSELLADVYTRRADHDGT